MGTVPVLESVTAQITLSPSELFPSSDIIMRRSGHMLLTIHAATNSPAAESALLDLRTGASPGTSRFSIDEDGDLIAGGTLTIGGEVLNTTITRINQALNGINATVTAADLTGMTDGSTVSNHTHAGFEPFPTGAIVIWTGAIGSIPSGWVLCNGSNGTPDLRDRFILSVATAAENPGTTGGATNPTISAANMASHTHTGTINADGSSHSHTYSVPSSGSHNHTYTSPSSTSRQEYTTTGPSTWVNNAFFQDAPASANQSHTITLDPGASHTHGFTSGSNGSGTAIDARPVYYTVAFIQKQ
jgi:hypothetical protein